MERLRSVVAAVTGNRRRFPSYRSLLIDRTADEEDIEIAVDVYGNDEGEEERHALIRQLAVVLRSEALLCSWPRLLQFVTERLHANVSMQCRISERLGLAYQSGEGADDDDDEARLPAFAVEDSPGVYIVDLLALLEMICHGLAYQADVHVTLQLFLQCYGSGCQYEATSASDAAGLLPRQKKVVSLHHTAVLVHQDSDFYGVLRDMIPDGFLDGEGTSVSPGFTDLQVVPLPVALGHVLTGRPRSESVSEATYDIVPLWPYFGWKHAKAKIQ